MKKTESSPQYIKKSVFFALCAIAVKQILKLVFKPKYPEACIVIRETLLATKKISYHQYTLDPTEPLSFPEIPFSLIEKCGTESFNMPFPFTFTFEENPVKEDVLVDKFLAMNKTVVYRSSYAFKNKLTPFASQVGLGAPMEKGPFVEVWPCIARGDCVLYFDNTWKKEDYQTIMTKSAADTLVKSSLLGSMFMSNFPAYQQSAPAHAAAVKSLATQMTNKKDWVFIDPYIVGKLLPVEKADTVTNIPLFNQDHDKILKTIPRYWVTTKAGQGVYFPEFWIHIVFTDPGVSIMTNWRMQINILDMMWNSPHKAKNTWSFAWRMFMKKFVLPESIAAKAQAKSQDTYQKILKRYYDMRMSVYAKNSGKELYGDGQVIYTSENRG